MRRINLKLLPYSLWLTSSCCSKKKTVTYRKSTWLHAEVRVNVIASTKLSNKKKKNENLVRSLTVVAFRIATMTAQCLEEILLKYALRPTIIIVYILTSLVCLVRSVCSSFRYYYYQTKPYTRSVYSNCAFVFGTLITTVAVRFIRTKKPSESNQNISIANSGT